MVILDKKVANWPKIKKFLSAKNDKIWSKNGYFWVKKGYFSHFLGIF